MCLYDKEFEDITYRDQSKKEKTIDITINMQEYGEFIYEEEAIHPSSPKEIQDRKKDFIIQSISKQSGEQVKDKDIVELKSIIDDVDDSYDEYLEEIETPNDDD